MDCPHLYLIADAHRRFVKVGVSRDPEQRLRQLNSPLPLMLVGSWPLENAYKCEKYLHYKLSVYRTNREWFRYEAAAKVYEFLGEMMCAEYSIAKAQESRRENLRSRARCRDGDCPALASPSGTGYCSKHDWERTRVGEKPAA